MLKKYLPKTLFGRTFLIVVIPVLILQVAVSIVFLDRHWSKMTERLAFAVTGEILAVANQIELDPNDADRLNMIKAEVAESLSLSMHFQRDNALHHIDYRYPKPLIFSPFHTMERDLIREFERRSAYDFLVMEIHGEKQVDVYLQLSNGLLKIEIPEGRLFSSSSYIFLLWMVGLSLLLFTIAMIFMRNQIRPIYRLGIIAERLGRGIPVGHIKPTGAREVRQASEAFIQMQSRIHHYIEQRTTMLAGVSHDLRTPLTRMKLQLEMMDDSVDKDAMRTDIHDMERMIEGYLSFAKGDGGEDMQRIQLSSLLDKTIDDARRLGLSVDDKRNGVDDMMIWGKPMALARVFDNLIQNTARYADKARVSVDMDEKDITIIFEDDGTGIPENKMQDVLKPFVRGEESRNQKTGGVGLGLSIANDIILSHAGRLKLAKSNDLGGLKVVITLPL